MPSKLLKGQVFGDDQVAIVRGILHYKRKIGVRNENQSTLNNWRHSKILYFSGKVKSGYCVSSKE
jgi:hypothetical protein